MPEKYLFQKGGPTTFRGQGPRSRKAWKPRDFPDQREGRLQGPYWPPDIPPDLIDDFKPPPDSGDGSYPDNPGPPGQDNYRPPKPRPPGKPPGGFRPTRPFKPGIPGFFWDYVIGELIDSLKPIAPYYQHTGYYLVDACFPHPITGWGDWPAGLGVSAGVCYVDQLFFGSNSLPPRPTGLAFDTWGNERLWFGGPAVIRDRVATYAKPSLPALPQLPLPIEEELVPDDDPYPDYWPVRPTPIYRPPLPIDWPDIIPPNPNKPVPGVPEVPGHPQPDRPPRPPEKPPERPPWVKPPVRPPHRPPRPEKPQPGVIEIKVRPPFTIPDWLPDVTEIGDFLECLAAGLPKKRKKRQTLYDAVTESLGDGTFNELAFLHCLVVNHMEDMVVGFGLGAGNNYYHQIMNDLFGPNWRPPPNWSAGWIMGYL